MVNIDAVYASASRPAVLDGGGTVDGWRLMILRAPWTPPAVIVL
jgi:hypothetical protein